MDPPILRCIFQSHSWKPVICCLSPPPSRNCSLLDKVREITISQGRPTDPYADNTAAAFYRLPAGFRKAKKDEEKEEAGKLWHVCSIRKLIQFWVVKDEMMIPSSDNVLTISEPWLKTSLDPTVSKVYFVLPHVISCQFVAYDSLGFFFLCVCNWQQKHITKVNEVLWQRPCALDL